MESSSSSSSRSSSSSESLSSSSYNREETYDNIRSPDTFISRTSQYSNTGGSGPKRKNSNQHKKRGSKKQNRVQFEVTELKSPDSKNKSVHPS
mmetsp:Transcript_7969/g.12321  ORF Transcript_7969/g.12321 Transcript_7969/m.12321 type:complete len:93 (+) Transcript_7969:899-1177(+)